MSGNQPLRRSALGRVFVPHPERSAGLTWREVSRGGTCGKSRGTAHIWVLLSASAGISEEPLPFPRRGMPLARPNPGEGPRAGCFCCAAYCAGRSQREASLLAREQSGREGWVLQQCGIVESCEISIQVRSRPVPTPCSTGTDSTVQAGEGRCQYNLSCADASCVCGRRGLAAHLSRVAMSPATSWRYFSAVTTASSASVAVMR